MLLSPRRICVPRWPMAPAVLTVLTILGSKPTRGSPVVTIGAGNGAFFIHHSRYSTRARYPLPRSTVGSEEAVPESLDTSGGLLGSTAASDSGGLVAGNHCAHRCPAICNHTPKTQ